ncbi:MAG: hypothetical protein ACW98Y_08985 [Candidatus Thorarchaeota archaeon]
MKFRRTFFIGSLAALLLFVAVSGPVQADVIGSTYSFSATWYEQSYQVDGVVVQQDLLQGTFQIQVHNITSSDAYEYTFTGMNSHHIYDVPYYDEQNDTISFDDNIVYFDLDCTDEDENGLAEDVGVGMAPGYHYHNPGDFLIVNPVWDSHINDWDDSVTEAESEEGFQSITESADEGIFSFLIIVDVEYEHSDYGNMTGTSTFTFSASYDVDGVLNTWDFTQATSLQNDDHAVINTWSQRFARGTGAGSGFVGTSDLMADVAIAGIALVGGLLIGVIIARRYYN